jgi:hypothetical protein
MNTNKEKCTRCYNGFVNEHGICGRCRMPRRYEDTPSVTEDTSTPFLPSDWDTPAVESPTWDSGTIDDGGGFSGGGGGSDF